MNGYAVVRRTVFQSLRLQCACNTQAQAAYAEGIACRVPVPEALDMMVGRVDDVMLVSEEQMRAAQAQLTAATGITAEVRQPRRWPACSRTAPARRGRPS